MRNKDKGSNLLIFAIITTITIFVWIFVEVYKTLNKRSFESVPESVLSPITPTLDTDLLTNIGNKKYYSDSVITSIQPESSSSAVPTN